VLISRNLDTVYKYKDTIFIFNSLLMHIEKKKFSSEYLKNLKLKLINKGGITSSFQIKKLANLVNLVSDRKNMYYLPINILTLWDYQCLINLQRFKIASGPYLKTWLEVIGEMEALNSLSIIAYEHRDWTMPKFQTGSPVFKARKLGHPLLGNSRVYNDINIEKSQNVLLITGSNMSGKSTLLRTTGINLVLAYAGAPVCAESFSCSIMDIYTCMRTSDNLEKNISSFYAELLRIKKLVTATKDKAPIFFLLDEIFKGTNSIDRHTGATVLVTKLSTENALGFVSTHDLELGDIENTNKKVKNYHLREYYKENKLYFDYKLRPGVSTTRNALYLMKMAGLEIPKDMNISN
jgi:DNA mismatch repair ATPase MutS